MLVPKFNRSLNLGLPKLNEDRSANIVHAEHAVFRWFAVGLDGDSGFPTSFQSEPSSVEPVEHKRGVKPLVLVNNNLAEDNDEVRGNLSRSPGGPVAENVWPDVLSAYKIVKNELEKKPTIARFGEVHFHRYVIWFPLLLQRECFVNNLLHLGSEKEGQVAEETTFEANEVILLLKCPCYIHGGHYK